MAAQVGPAARVPGGGPRSVVLPRPGRREERPGPARLFRRVDAPALMTLRELAQTFARLENAGGRPAAVRVGKDLFARARPAELAPVTYLLQGQLRPPFEGVDFGVGERLLVRVVARAYGVNEPDVERRFKRLGDLGLVAEAV